MNKPSYLLQHRKLFIFVPALLILITSAVYLLIIRERPDSINSDFSKYLESYTSGLISRSSPIRIRLSDRLETNHIKGETGENLFTFSPEIKGKAYWIDGHTLEFRPDKQMVKGTKYKVDFNLGKVGTVPSLFKHFLFSFSTIKPDFTISFDGLQTGSNSSLTNMKLTGSITTADKEDPDLVEKVLIATCPSPLTVSWIHDTLANTHTFTIANIKRLIGNTPQLLISWNGKVINVDKTSSQAYEIPDIGIFKVLQIRTEQKQGQFIEIQFSNPLLPGQELNGLIEILHTGAIATSIDGSLVKLYAPVTLQGDYTVAVAEGILDINRKRLKDRATLVVNFKNELPQVTIPGKGSILPDSGQLKIGFDVINLKAVDVSIIKVYEKNMPQFLQNNDFEGDQLLRQVGIPVIQTTVRLDLDKTLNLKAKNHFMLDIDRLLKTEPGAMYRIIIGFRKEYALYNCQTGLKGKSIDEKSPENEADNDDGSSSSNYGEKVDEHDTFWKQYNGYYPEGFDWQKRQDPCSNSYYTQDKWAKRNILTSNLGLIAKLGADNRLHIAVTSILTALPIKNVELTLLDYQKQTIATVLSDMNGFAISDLQRKPYLLLAKKGSERGYLKLDDGGALLLSKFDVAGEQLHKGIKGFIYAERGVWRPGDSIYISFILRDKLNQLPADHPVRFELFNPSGQLFRRMTRITAIDGFYDFHTATAISSPTGTWIARVKVGGAEFEKSIKIETIMPNRLKVDLSFNGRIALTAGMNTTGLLSARWLFGGAAQQLRAKVDAFVSSQSTRFKGFEGYSFDDPTLAFNTQTQNLFDGRLSADGKVKIDAKIRVDKQAPGQLSANFVIKVFEPGGNFSIQQLALVYNAYKSYVGIKPPEGSAYSGMLLTDQINKIKIASVNVDGVPVTGSKLVDVELYKIQWRWWWDESGDNLSNFTQNKYNKLVQKAVINLVNGHGDWKLQVRQNDWGRYLIKVKDPQDGHSTGKIIYVDYAERLQQDNSTEATMLSFTADKKSYKVGETAQLTIPTGQQGRALISIENGSKVIKTVWINTIRGQTHYSLSIEKEMTPNIFVNVTLLQAHAQTLNDLPIRMYGVIPLLVNDPATLLKPLIIMADKIKPQQATSLTIAEANGKEMTFTIAIVDEGLLDLTNFKTPDPHNSFYAREALGVKTWDLFDNVIGAYGNDLGRILSIGGDQALMKNQNISVNRFKPIVKFMGPFHLNSGQRQIHTFTLPQYIGSVRVMVIGAHQDSYGFAQKPVAVKKSLMILSTLPRVLGPTENFMLPVTVFCTDKNLKKVTVTVISNAMSSIKGPQKQVVDFDSPGEKLITFNFKVKAFVGIGNVNISAIGGTESATSDVQLNIRNPNPLMTKTIEKELAAGQSWQVGYQGIGMTGTNKANLEVSSLPAINLAGRLAYLIDYPHGCLEQTTSAAFPQLYLDQLLDLSVRQKSETEKNIKAAIDKLGSFQLPDGGLSYWPGENLPDEWCTNYAGHFLLTAQAKGFTMPVGFLGSWKKFQQRKAINWVPDSHSFYGDDLLQAYRLYLLALAHQPELGAMNRLKEFKYLSIQAKWRLAAAYKLAGQPETGLRMINVLATKIAPYKQLSETYGSELRDQAMILETLILLGQRQKASALVQTIALSLSKNTVYSTQSTAYCLLSIAGYCQQNKPGSKLSFISSATPVNSASYLWQSTLVADQGKVLIKNTGNNMLFIRLNQMGQPSPGQELSNNQDNGSLVINVKYRTLQGGPIAVENLKQGTDFIAQVRIKNPGKQGRYDNLALTEIFPSGWEILNSRMMNNEELFKSAPADYRDIRDDRVNTYFSLRAGQEATYFVMLNAAYTGHFYLPAAYCEAMYDNSINALEKGRWVNVIK